MVTRFCAYRYMNEKGEERLALVVPNLSFNDGELVWFYPVVVDKRFVFDERYRDCAIVPQLESTLKRNLTYRTVHLSLRGNAHESDMMLRGVVYSVCDDMVFAAEVSGDHIHDALFNLNVPLNAPKAPTERMSMHILTVDEAALQDPFLRSLSMRD